MKIYLLKFLLANKIKNLPTGKASASNDIPVSIMTEAIDIYCPKLTQIMNDCLKKKNAEITLKC